MGAIKFFPVDEGALIIYFNRVGVLRLFPRPTRHDFVLQAVWQRGYLLLLSHLLFLFLREVLLEALHRLSELLFGQGSRLFVEDVENPLRQRILVEFNL